MKKIIIDYDLSGYAYDPDNPTAESEKLCYKLNAILDTLKTQQIELRMSEPADYTAAETYLESVFDSIFSPDEENPLEYTSPDNLDILMDPGIADIVGVSRGLWLQKALSDAGVIADSEVLAKIEENLRLMLAQEHVVFLSDGTPIYMKSGLVGP